MSQTKEAIDLIEKIKDQANRATMVQDRSVGIIKQTCGYIFSECVQVLDLLRKEQPEDDVGTIKRHGILSMSDFPKSALIHQEFTEKPPARE